MRFSSLIFKNLLRRRSRSFLTITGLAVAVTATTALLSIAWGYAQSARGYYENRRIDIVVVRAGVSERITSSLNSSALSRLKSLPGIADVEGTLTEMVSLGGGGLVGIPLHGIQTDGLALSQYAISAGRTLLPDDQDAVLLGQGLATSLKTAPGGSVDIEGTPFKVVGLFLTADALESNTAAAPLAAVQRLMDRPNQVSEFQIRVDSAVSNEADLKVLCEKIEQLRDDAGKSLGFHAMPVREFVSSGTETGLLNAMAWGTSAIAVFLSCVGVLNTMVMSVLERTREFGILRAVGWSHRRVMLMVLGESLLMSAAAVVLGLGLAATAVRILSRVELTKTLVQPSLLPVAIISGTSIGLIAGVLGAFYPAFRASRVPPREALHYE
jgi:putative ABC transport system permease protein